MLIGGRERHRVVIVDYDPSWPARFEFERQRIRTALRELAIRVEHIGSTAMPGLAAKPIVDVLVTVRDPEDEGALVTAMRSIGYELRVQRPSDRENLAGAIARLAISVPASAHRRNFHGRWGFLQPTKRPSPG